MVSQRVHQRLITLHAVCQSLHIVVEWLFLVYDMDGQKLERGFTENLERAVLDIPEVQRSQAGGQRGWRLAWCLNGSTLEDMESFNAMVNMKVAAFTGFYLNNRSDNLHIRGARQISALLFNTLRGICERLRGEPRCESECK